MKRIDFRILIGAGFDPARCADAFGTFWLVSWRVRFLLGIGFPGRRSLLFISLREQYERRMVGRNPRYLP